jgi:tRNA (cytidine/uridine-2'-O-)-methyltransferase
MPTVRRESDTGYVQAQSQEELLAFHPEVVLYRPQIPQNTGSIARLCAAFSCALHLIEPMGFRISEKALRRAGLDYWTYVRVYLHENWGEFRKTQPNRRLIFIETGGAVGPHNFTFLPGDRLVFGAETFGIEKHIFEEEKERARAENTVGENAPIILTLPMFERGVRSINLSQTVGIVLYQALAEVWQGSL